MLLYMSTSLELQYTAASVLAEIVFRAIVA
jgi:hypothetical protein